jgi:transcriptional regulator with XRE-family HTH domain
MSGYPDTEYLIRGPQSFGLALREFRARNGKTQAELARTAGLHRSYLSWLERGGHTEALGNIIKVCVELDLEVVVRPRGPGRA